MTPANFVKTVDELQVHLAASVTEFFRAKGIEPNWNAYWENSSTDHEQASREILFYAGDLWPGVENTVETRVAA